MVWTTESTHSRQLQSFKPGDTLYYKGFSDPQAHVGTTVSYEFMLVNSNGQQSIRLPQPSMVAGRYGYVWDGSYALLGEISIGEWHLRFIQNVDGRISYVVRYFTIKDSTIVPPLMKEEVVRQTNGAGVAFAVIGIGAGVGAVAGGLVFALSSRAQSEVYVIAGHYYWRHRVPVLPVRGRMWCPAEGRFLKS